MTTNAETDTSSDSWIALGTRFTDSSTYFEPMAFAPDGTLYMAYSVFSSDYIEVQKYDGSSWTQVGDTFYDNAISSAYPSVAVAPDGTPYLAYVVNSYGSCAVHVWKYNGSKWVEEVNSSDSNGPSGSDCAAYTSLAFAPDGTPYLAYVDSGNNWAPMVMKFNGSSWSAVGGGAVSSYEVNSNVALAFAPDGTPYLAYSFYDEWDNDCPAVLTVETYNSVNGWEWVEPLSATAASYDSLAFAPDGTLYLAYEDEANGDAAMVMKYDGSSWTTVGGGAVSTGSAYDLSLAIGPDGTPYVAYEDDSNSDKATVMKYAGSSWAAVGGAGISAGGTDFESLAFAPNGVPYLAYTDYNEDGRTTVIRVAQVPTATTSAASSITANDATLNGTVNDNGTDTTVEFEYGTTSGSYSSTVAATTNATIAAGTGASSVAATLTGLSAGTTYYYRVVATNAGGTVTGNEASFTTLAQPVVTVTVSAASSTYGASTATLTASVTYSGTTSPTGAVTFMVGTGSAVTASCTGTSSPLTCNASYPTSTLAVNSYTITVSIAGDSNYSFASGTSTLTVTQVPLVITASSATVNYGTAVPTITPSYSGWVNNDSASALTTAPTCSTTYTTTSTKEVYPTTCSGAVAANYSISYVAGAITVSTNSQTITFAQPTTPVTYGASSVALSATASSGLSVSYTGSGACSVSGSTLSYTGAGICTVTAAQAGNGSYAAATPVTHTVTVNLAPLVITASSATVNYGAVVPTITPSYSGWVNNDTVSALTTAPTCSTTYMTTSAAGSYSTSCAGAVAANYSISYVTGAIKVSQITPTVALISAENPALLGDSVTLTATVSSSAGIPAGKVNFLDGSTALGSGTLASGVATFSTSSLAVGTHTITAAYAGDSNHVAATSNSLSQVVEDYTITSTGSTNQTILPGGSAIFTYNLTPTTGSTLPVAATITVTGLPSGATAILNGTGWTALSSTSWQLPANTATSTTTLTITAPSSTTASDRNDFRLRHRMTPIALGLLLLPFAGRLRRSGKHFGRYGILTLVLALGAFATAGLSGCSGSAGTFFAQSQKSYAVTVTVAAGSLTHTDTVTLTVE